MGYFAFRREVLSQRWESTQRIAWDAARRRGLCIIRFRINAKAHSLRRSSSPHPTRCRWAWMGTPDLFHHTAPKASMPAFPGPLLRGTRAVTAVIAQGILADQRVSALIFARPGTFRLQRIDFCA